MRSVLVIATLALAVGCEPDGVLRHCELSEGTICPWAGTGDNGFNGDGRDRLDTTFSFPMSVTFSPYGDPMVADWNNHRIRRLDPETETFETIMGTDFLGDGDPDMLDRTEAGAPGTEVRLNHPTQQQYFEDGILLSASWHTHKLRTWDPATGLVHVYLGDTPGFETVDEGSADDFHDADNCNLNQPSAVEIRPDGDVYIVDMRNERVRLLEVDPWLVGTVAGNGEQGYCGEGEALETCFGFPKNANPEPGGSVAYDAESDLLYIADTTNNVIRVLDVQAGTTSLLAGSPEEAGDADGVGDQARFDWPARIVLDADTGTLFVADSNNHKVKAIDVQTGEVTTFAGTGEPTCDGDTPVNVPRVCEEQARSGDGGPASEARLYRPFGVDLDLDGNLVVSDTYNQRFRVIGR